MGKSMSVQTKLGKNIVKFKPFVGILCPYLFDRRLYLLRLVRNWCAMIILVAAVRNSIFASQFFQTILYTFARAYLIYILKKGTVCLTMDNYPYKPESIFLLSQ